MSDIALNPALDWAVLNKQYQESKRLQIRDFLQVESAQRLFSCLEKEIDWHLAFLDGKPETISYQQLQQKSADDYRQLQKRLATVAIEQPFHYLYDCYPLLQAYKESWNPELFANRWLEFVNTPPLLDKIRQLTGLNDIARCDGQAARYGPNQYLTRHTDEAPSEGRLAAYVLNLTPNWDPNWGGYLQFFDKGKNLEDGFMPEFNTLNIFTVPQDHSVGTIAQFAQRYRYSLVGWFRAAESA